MMTSDEEKRWLVVGIAMNKVVASILRDFIKQGMDTHYTNLDVYCSGLATPCTLKTLTYHQVSTDPCFKHFKFQNINNNLQLYGMKKKDLHKYNYNINSSVDLAKLFLPDYLAEFSGFDESLDMSAILRLLGFNNPAPIFYSPNPLISIQLSADDVRENVRNTWGHCNVTDWTEVFFNDCFSKLKTLVKSLGLTSGMEKMALDKLSDWETKGCQLCMGHAVDHNLSLVQQVVKKLIKDYKTTEESVAQQRGDLTVMQNTLTSIQDQQSATRVQQEEHDEQLAAVLEWKEQQEKENEEILAKFVSVEKMLSEELLIRVEGVEKGLVEIDDKVDQLFAMTEEKVEQLKQGFAKTDDKVEQLEQGFAKTDDKVGQLEQGFAKTDDKVEQLEQGFAKTDDKVEQLEQGFAKTDDKVGQLEQGFAKTDDKVEQLEQGFAKTDDKVEQLVQGFANVEKDVSETENKVKQLEEAVRSQRMNENKPALVPPEIQERGPEAQSAFLKAMWSGEVQVYRSRIMFIGQDRAGKTSLKKSLLGIFFDPQEDSTVGIEVDPSKFEVDVDRVMNWQRTQHKDFGVHEFNEDIAKLIATDLMYPNSLSVQMQPTEQIDRDVHGMDQNSLSKKMQPTEHVDPDVRRMDQNSLSKKENVSMEGIGSKTPGAKKFKLDEKEGKERNEPFDLDIETSVVFSSELMERVVRYLKHLKLDQEIKAKEYVLDMWDFAGQHLYYASHPVFFSSRAVYILVCNLSKELNAIAEPCVKQGITRKLKNTNGETNLENLLSWLVSVRRLRPETEDDGKLLLVRPKVIIVGTNADSRAVEDRNEMWRCIQKSLTENDDLQKHVIRKLFSIDNTGSQADDREALKNEILDVLSREPYMGEKVPVRWFHFEKIVQALVAKKMYHVKREDLQTIIKKVCRIEDMKELKSMLDFYHDLGQIVQHGSTVVLDTKWLIDLFKQVITVKPFNESESNHNKFWVELQDHGILRMELIDHMFDEHIKKGLNKEDILSLMEHYGLIAKFSPDSKSKEPRYFVPAQLTSPPAKLCEKKPSDCDPCLLYVNFTEGFVPQGLFPQLLTRYIAWCSKDGFPKEPQLYDCGARFFIGEQTLYSLVIICRKRSIKVVLRKINSASRPSHSTSKDLEPWDVRAFLDHTLACLSQELPWLRNLEFEWCVACTDCQCAKHKSVCCPHEECLHLHKVDFSKTTIMIICEKSLKDETMKISGLDKWLQASKESETEKHSKANPLPSTDQSNASEVEQSSMGKRRKSSCSTQVSKKHKMKARDRGPSASKSRKPSGKSSTQKREQTRLDVPNKEVKEGCPSYDELEELSLSIGSSWESLARRLGFTLGDITGFRKNNEEYQKKALNMLFEWKQNYGSDATYKVLHSALCHQFVGRRDLAEKFCCC